MKAFKELITLILRQASLVLALALVLIAHAHAGVTYVYSDHLGSPIAETDEQGNITKRYYYKPFGETIGTEPEDIGYTGHKHDADTGLTYMQARYYNPRIGRFYSNDPVDFQGHLQRGNPIHGFNRYAYANNNPYKYTDPDGKAPIVPLVVAACVATRCVQKLTEAAVAVAVYATEESTPAKTRSRAKRRASRAAQRKKKNPKVAVSQPGKNIQGNKFGEDNLRGQEKTGMDGKTKVGIQDGSKDSSNNTTDHKPAVDVGNMKAGEQPGSNGQPRIKNEDKVKEDI